MSSDIVLKRDSDPPTRRELLTFVPGFTFWDIFIRLSLILSLTGLTKFMMMRTVLSLNLELLIHLPMHLFWTFCIYRINQLLGERFGGERPISDSGIVLLSVLSFVCMPTFGMFHLVSRFIDPIFICWLICQCAWPYIFAKFIQKHEPQRVGTSAWYAPLLACLANGYVVAGAMIPVILSTEPYFDVLWFASQFLAVGFFYSQIVSSYQLANQEISESLQRKLAFTGEDVTIKYNPFSGMDRWFKQRFNEKSLLRGTRLLLAWFVGPVVVLAVVALLYNYINVTPAGTPQAEIPAVVAANQAFVSLFLGCFVGGILTLIAGFILFMRLQPTRIRLDKEGFAFLWGQNTEKRSGKGIPWSDVTYIGIESKPGQASTSESKIVLNTSKNTKLTIKLNAINSVEEKELLLKSIQAFAPTVARAPEVAQCLKAPADHSYTEMWLEALTAPPQRDKLKPLADHARLKNGNYVVKRALGVGGQGHAYLASDTIEGRDVVLKEFILPVYVDVSIRKAALEQFENEAKILNSLDNPRIVKLIDFFVEDHRAYLILEHIEGDSLRKIVETKGALSEKETISLAGQMCDMLTYLHGLKPPVVHRDFTPDNLILRNDGTLKLIDFNVAQQKESTTMGTVVGKHAYLPPEQFRGMPTPQSDLYAMGATLFFLLTGQDPEPITVSHPQEVVPTVSKDMDDLVARATNLDEKLRYSTAAELLLDIDVLKT